MTPYWYERLVGKPEPPELAKLDAEIERLRAENRELRQTNQKTRAELHTEIKRLRADKAELLAALEKSVELQSHYASLLNQYDAGTRILFNSVGAWMDRLRAITKAESK